MQVFEGVTKDFWQSVTGKRHKLKGRLGTSRTIGIILAVVVQIEWVGGCSRMQINQCLFTAARAKRRWNMREWTSARARLCKGKRGDTVM